MAEKIKAHSALLNNLTLAQNLQFHVMILNHVGPDMKTIPELITVVNAWEVEVTEFDELFRKGGYRYATLIVSGRDSGRDYTTRVLVDRVSSIYTHPFTDEEKQNGPLLQTIIDTYKKADRKDYPSETTFLRNLISDMRKYPAILAQHGLTEIVDRLDLENTDFDTAYIDRNDLRKEGKEQGDLQGHRRKANYTFDNVGKVITGLMLTPIAPAVKTKLENIIGVININIDQFTTIYHQHASITAKHKKKDDDKEDAGTETPGTNPPGNPTQNPDNTLPSAPDTPNQNPGTGPHPLDPNEHPSMGEM